MSSLALALDVVGAGDVSVASVVPPPPISILAQTLPTMSALYDGQTVQDVTDYSTMIDPANFETQASVQTVTVDFTGDAVAADDALVAGETAGFVVTVTDTAGDVHVFNAGTTVVQYQVHVTSTAGNEALLDINPLVPDMLDIAVTIDTTDYTRTVGELGGPIYQRYSRNR